MGTVVAEHHPEPAAGAPMIRWKARITGCAAVIVLSMAGFFLAPASGAAARAAHVHPATGVGSCTLINWKNSDHPIPDANSIPLGHRPMSYKPDNYDCKGAKFAKPGVEFRKFPQPRSFRVVNHKSAEIVDTCSSVKVGSTQRFGPLTGGQAGPCGKERETVWKPTPAINPLA